MFFRTIRTALKATVVLVSFLGVSGLAASEESINTSEVGVTIETEAGKEPQKSAPSVEPAEKVVKSSVEVIEFVLANRIEDREPKEIVEAFSQENGTGKAYAFARLCTKNPIQVTFVWFREGKEQSRFTTNVQEAKRWRTYAWVKLRPGNWKVQLVSDNAILAERTFIVQ